MRIAIVTVGTTGDVVPLVALGTELQRRGHRVVVVTHEDFTDLVTRHGLEFRDVGGRSVHRLLASDEGRAWIASGNRPIQYLRKTKQLVGPLLDSWGPRFEAETHDADAVLFIPGSAVAVHAAQARGLPTAMLSFIPWVLSRDFESPILPPLGPLNQAMWRLAATSWWWTFGGHHQRERQRLGLPPLRKNPFSTFIDEGLPIFHLYSPSLLPQPADWPPSVLTTGFCALPAEVRPPDPELVAFVEDGDPPVYVGFGSMTGTDPEALTDLVVRAVLRSGRRAVVVTGVRDCRPPTPTARIHVVDHAPHAWLLPRMEAVIHHGGVGTLQAALVAGKPSGIVPFFGDQPFWARRMRSRGVARVLPRHRLTDERLADFIVGVTSDRSLRLEAARLGARLAAEDGLARSADAVEAAIM